MAENTSHYFDLTGAALLQFFNTSYSQPLYWMLLLLKSVVRRWLHIALHSRWSDEPFLLAAGAMTPPPGGSGPNSVALLLQWAKFCAWLGIPTDLDGISDPVMFLQPFCQARPLWCPSYV